MQIISTVLAPASSSTLVTWASVKLELNLPDTEQGWTTSAINRASSLISGFCDRAFGVQQIRDDFLPDRDSSPWVAEREPLLLSNWPVVSISSITVSGDTLTAGTDYRFDPEIGAVYRLDSSGDLSRWAAQPTSITYMAGYVLPADSGYAEGGNGSLPAEIVDAALSLVSSRYFGRRRDPLLKSEDVPDVGAAAYWVGSIGDEAMPQNIVAILDSYRKRNI